MEETKTGSDPMKDKTKYLTWGSIGKLIESCTEERDMLFFLLASSTGRRVGELIRLKVEDIDFENNTIVWNIEKKRKEHRVVLPVNPPLVSKLKEYIQKDNLTEWVFPSPRRENKPICIRYWQKKLSKIAENNEIKTAGGQRPHFHSIRHSVAVRILDKTGDIRLVQRALQHSSLSITSHYLDVSNKDFKDKMEGVLDI
jgi:integrase